MAGFWIVSLWLALMPIIAGFVIAVVGWCIFCGLLRIVAYWKLFGKAKEPEWAVFVPFMNVYKAYKISIGKMWFWFWLVGNAVLVFLLTVENHMVDSPLYDSGQFDGYLSVMDTCCAVLLIILAVLTIVQRVKLAKAFGASGGFAVGLVLIPDLFLLILGFGRQYQYVREQPNSSSHI